MKTEKNKASEWRHLAAVVDEVVVKKTAVTPVEAQDITPSFDKVQCCSEIPITMPVKVIRAVGTISHKEKESFSTVVSKLIIEALCLRQDCSEETE